MPLDPGWTMERAQAVYIWALAILLLESLAISLIGVGNRQPLFIIFGAAGLIYVLSGFFSAQRRNQRWLNSPPVNRKNDAISLVFTVSICTILLLSALAA